MQIYSKPTAGLFKSVLRVLLFVGLVVAVVAAALAFWAYKRQTSALIYSANLALAPYGVTVVAIDGLQITLEQARADSVTFLLDGQPAQQHLHSLVIDYELPSLLGGRFTQLAVESADLHLQVPDVTDSINVSMNSLTVRCPDSATSCDGHTDVTVQSDEIGLDATAIRATLLHAAGHVRFEYTEPELRLDITPGLALNLEQASVSDAGSTTLQIGQFSLLTQQTWRFDLDTEQQLLVFGVGQSRIQVPVIRNYPDTDAGGLSGFELDVLQINGSYSLAADDTARPWQERLTVQARLEASGIYTTLQPFNLWGYRWPMSLEWDASQNLQLGIDAVTQQKQIAGLTLRHNSGAGSGSAQLQTPLLAFTGSADALSTLISPLPLDADLVSGQLTVSGNVSWQMPAGDSSAGAGFEAWEPQGTISLRAVNLAGVIDETIFTGLNTAADFRLQPDLTVASTGTTALQLASVDPGFPLSNIDTQFQLDMANSQLSLESLKFDMFDGRIDADPFIINFGGDANSAESGEPFELRIDALDISRVLQLSAYEAVSATGLLSGALPVRLQGITPVIENGQLHALPPGGSIHYSGGSETGGNQSLDLVYQALAHYRYETLTAAVAYNESGELTLGMQLQGVSPELNGGQRINLNLNISDNIPALLQSLQAAQGITDRLEELLE